jgi:hypothetical protein
VKLLCFCVRKREKQGQQKHRQMYRKKKWKNNDTKKIEKLMLTTDKHREIYLGKQIHIDR